MGRKKKNIVEVVQTEFPEFSAEVMGLTIDQLNNRLATLAKYAEDNDNTKDADEELLRTKELATELAAPYKEAHKAIKMKSKFIIQLLKDKGADA